MVELVNKDVGARDIRPDEVLMVAGIILLAASFIWTVVAVAVVPLIASLKFAVIGELILTPVSPFAGDTVVTTGTELTLTTTFWVLIHPFAVNVITYVTFTAVLNVLTSVSLIVPVPAAAALLIPGTAARLQEKVVPEVMLAGI